MLTDTPRVHTSWDEILGGDVVSQFYWRSNFVNDVEVLLKLLFHLLVVN